MNFRNGLTGKKFEFIKQALSGLENLKELEVSFWKFFFFNTFI